MEGQEASWSIWDAKYVVKRAVIGPERPIGGSRDQLEGLRGLRRDDHGASQRFWEASH